MQIGCVIEYIVIENMGLNLGRTMEFSNKLVRH